MSRLLLAAFAVALFTGCATQDQLVHPMVGDPRPTIGEADPRRPYAVEAGAMLPRCSVGVRLMDDGSCRCLTEGPRPTVERACPKITVGPAGAIEIGRADRRWLD